MRAISLLVTTIFLVGFHPQHRLPSPLVEPPFVRQWTQLLGEQTRVIAVREGVVYGRSHNGLEAFDLRTGQRHWSSLPKQRIVAGTLEGRTLYAIGNTEKTSILYAVDSVSGQSRILTRLATISSDLVADAERIYLLDEAGKLWAYHPTSGTVLWKRPLTSARTRGVLMAQLVLTANGLYVGLDDVGELGIALSDGKILWERRVQYAGLYRPIVVESDVITQHGGLQRLNVRTGKIVWKSGPSEGDANLVGDIVVASNQKELVGREVAKGAIRWRLPLRDANTGYVNMNDPPTLSDGTSVWIDRNPFLCVTRDGREKWFRHKPFTGTPVYADEVMIVTEDDTRLLGYRQGTLPPLPTQSAERRTLAEHLATQFELLDDAERQQIVTLSPYSLGPLLARYVEWARAYEAKPEGESSYFLYTLLTDANPLLHQVCRKEDTKAIVTALSRLGEKSSWRDDLEQILEKKGEQAEYIPLLVARLRRLPLAKRQESTTLSAVSHASHPDAVALMLEALRDPKAAPAWRREAFQHLAGTGGPAGVEAVRKARLPRRTLPPWFSQIEGAKLRGRRVLSLKQDSQGHTWVLFHSAVLGNQSDLFIIQKQGEQWGRPLFTGVWTDRTFDHAAPKTFRGIPMAKLIATEWVRIFPQDASIRRDSDGDELTDSVETRLGTNLYRADTDGDGVGDAVDPCPNAAPRPLNDTEKIVAACLEARFFEEDWRVPAVISLEGCRPFELYGYPQALMWQRTKGEHPLAKLYGGGVNLLGFHLMDEKSPQDKAFIHYSPDRQRASTIISRYSGGLNGDGIEVTLQKIGDEWFVIDLQSRYVS